MPSRPCRLTRNAPALGVLGDGHAVTGASWRRGVVRPNCVHLVETEDGTPRLLAVASGSVAVAICQAWLTGEPVTGDQSETAHLEHCPVCVAIWRDLPHARDAVQ